MEEIVVVAVQENPDVAAQEVVVDVADSVADSVADADVADSVADLEVVVLTTAHGFGYYCCLVAVAGNKQ